MGRVKFNPQNTVVINATNIGFKYHGLGVYSLNLLKELTKLKTGLRFIVYVNKTAAPHLSGIKFPQNFLVKWVSKSLSPDYKFKGHLMRLIFSNLLSLKYRKYLIFNTSQLEISFFRSNQVVTIHDVIPLLFKNYHKKQFIYYKLILKFGLKKARYILTPSHNSKDLLQEMYDIPDDRIRVIYNGADTLINKDKVFENKTGKPYLLYIGRICKMKNIKGIIESFGAIADKIPHDLIIVGNDWKVFIEELYFSQIDHRLRKRIKFKENVSNEEKCRLFKNAEMLIFPSFYEGFGLPPIEAMACGCPVIVSNNSSLPEICGDGAYYVNPVNIKEISTAILRLIKDTELRNELTAKGKERASNFRWDFSAVKHLWLLEQIVDSSTFPVVETHPLLLPVLESLQKRALSQTQS